MKRCLSCNTKFNNSSWTCPKCHIKPNIQEGYLCFSPDIENEGFPEGLFKGLFNHEEGNYWFSSRNSLIVWALQKYFPRAKTLLEIGCGTGYVLSGIKKQNPNLTLNGSDIFIKGIDFASKRLHNVEFFQMDARKIPFYNEYDVIGAFDIIEHISEDELVLSEIFKALNQGGGLIVTVPQHQFLWSSYDEFACHVRRYSSKELISKLERAGFKVLRMTSFISFLLPLMFISRLRNKNQKEEFDPFKELKINPILNKGLEGVLTLERSFIKAGVSFPFGGSLLLVGRKV
ncbi:MAG: class I SAM-dependent methyltransferase [Syntrophomonas sp.]